MADYLNFVWDQRNPNIPTALDELSLWAAPFGRLLLSQVALRSEMKILDIGCGTGFPALELARILGRTSYVLGLDLWRRALERAQFKLSVWDSENLAFGQTDGRMLPVRTAQVDLVVSNLGINNFEQPDLVLAECYRVLKSGGRLALTTNLKGHMAEFYEVYRQVLHELGKTECLERLADNEDHRGTRESVVGQVEAAGLTILKLVEDDFQLRYLNGTALLEHSLTKIGFLDGWRKIVDPADEEKVFKSIEASLNAIATRNGELPMTIPMLFLEAQK